MSFQLNKFTTLSSLKAHIFVIPSEARNLVVRLLRDFVSRNDSVKKYYGKDARILESSNPDT